MKPSSLAVYSHLVFLDDKFPRTTVDDIVAGTRDFYNGHYRSVMT